MKVRECDLIAIIAILAGMLRNLTPPVPGTAHGLRWKRPDHVVTPGQVARERARHGGPGHRAVLGRDGSAGALVRRALAASDGTPGDGRIPRQHPAGGGPGMPAR
jgi:hypothetical protein